MGTACWTAVDALWFIQKLIKERVYQPLAIYLRYNSCSNSNHGPAELANIDVIQLLYIRITNYAFDEGRESKFDKLRFLSKEIAVDSIYVNCEMSIWGVMGWNVGVEKTWSNFNVRFPIHSISISPEEYLWTHQELRPCLLESKLNFQIQIFSAADRER